MIKRACVTGGAGFIGHHLVRYLKEREYWVRAVDIKQPEFSSLGEADESWWNCDLRIHGNAVAALRGVDEIYALAANMGGMGWITFHDFEIIQDNLRINLNTASAAQMFKPKRLFYSSSACCYPEDLQLNVQAHNLVESDAWRGKPDTGYGIEKLTSESIYSYLENIEVRIARFHNTFGPEGEWQGGREKAPAALCRKIAEAKLFGNSGVEIWGDGEATRSYCYIDDLVEMIYRLMQSDYDKPMNLGTDRAVSVNELVDIIAEVAGIVVEKKHIKGPQGVRGRNADLSRMRKILGYEPQIFLEKGVEYLYRWIEAQVQK